MWLVHLLKGNEEIKILLEIVSVYPLTEGIGNSWGVGSQRPKMLRKFVKVSWNFWMGTDNL